jgi:hypothetical protein
MSPAIPHEIGGVDPYKRLLGSVQRTQGALVTHPLYHRINNLHSLRVFMRNHVFAVWDFMTLVKALQQRLTCVTLPWLPPDDILSARLINEIVLGEETDEVEHGHILSHYDLYLRAMGDVNADAGPMKELEEALRAGLPVEQGLAPLQVPGPTKDFVLHTMRVSRTSTHEIAAAFLLGREDVIPAMFRRILVQLDGQDGASLRVARRLRSLRGRTPIWVREQLPTGMRTVLHAMSEGRGDPRRNFRIYLERHIELDEGHHAPMGQRLLRYVCGTDEQKWREATAAAQAALDRRVALWNGVLAELSQVGERPGAARKVTPAPGADRAPRRDPQGASISVL